MKIIFQNIIQRGGYDLAALLAKIDTYHIEGKLTDEERTELYAMARLAPVAQYDTKAEIEKLWAAIRALQAQAGGGSPGAPVEEWPEFVQPTGAHDAYQVGAQVTYNGSRYICKMENCVWSPDTLPEAWDLVPEVTAEVAAE